MVTELLRSNSPRNFSSLNTAQSATEIFQTILSSSDQRAHGLLSASTIMYGSARFVANRRVAGAHARARPRECGTPVTSLANTIRDTEDSMSTKQSVDTLWQEMREFINASYASAGKDSDNEAACLRDY